METTGGFSQAIQSKSLSLALAPPSVGDPGADIKRRGVLSQRGALVLSF